ncbi:MAG: sugar phosphate isomerase/epimerase [Candidatus Firestonebacteria bacterium]
MEFYFAPYCGCEKVNILEILDFIKENGCVGIELFQGWHLFDNLDKDEWVKLKKELDARELKVSGVFVPGAFPISYPYYNEVAVNYLVQSCKCSKYFGGKYAAIWNAPPKPVTLEEGRVATSNVLKEVLDKAESLGISVAFEFEKESCFDNWKDTLNYILTFDKRVRAICDTFHLAHDKADAYEAGVQLGPYVSAVHLAEDDRSAPGQGKTKFDFKALKKGLDEIGYKGPYCLQYDLGEKAKNRHTIKESIDYLNSVMRQ